MGMADCAGKRICRVAGRRAFEVEQPLHHRLHLALVRTAKPDNCLFDTQRCIFVNHKPFGDRGANRSTARLPKQQCRLRIDADEDFFDRCDVRPCGANHLRERSQNRAEPLVQIPGGHTDHACSDAGELAAIDLNDAVSGPVQTRVNAEDANQWRWHLRIVPLGYALKGFIVQ